MGSVESCGVKDRLKVRHSLTQQFDAAEFPGDLHNVSVPGQGRHFQDGGDLELRGAVFGVFLQQSIENFARLRAVLFEEVAALRAKPFGTFAACSQRGVERDMAKQVEWIGVGLFGCFSQFVEVNGTSARSSMISWRPAGSAHFFRSAAALG